MSRIGAIDIGTNSVLLTIADCSDDGCVPVVERATITRLGRGVDRSGKLATDAIERTLACIVSYADALREHAVERFDAVGTSALRDAANAAEFVGPAERALGITPRVVTGVEEASLTFDGALSGLTLEGDVGVVDIGGGSTEFVVGRAGEVREVRGSAVSIDIGCVRLTERHCAGDPPSADQLASLRADIATALSAAPTTRRIDHLVAVAGTATTLAALELRLPKYDRARVHGFRLARSAIAAWVERLAAAPLAERRALPGLEPARADVIVAGAVALLAVVERTGKDACIVSERGVRWGLIERMWRGLRPERS